LNEFLGEEGVGEAAKAEALTRVVAWQLSQEMERQGLTKAYRFRQPANPLGSITAAR
jgi:hypothetical protein